MARDGGQTPPPAPPGPPAPRRPWGRRALCGPRRPPRPAPAALRGGGLLRPPPDDPPGFAVPPAPAWYRWVLQNPSVAVALMAPRDRAELKEDLTVLDADGPLPAVEYERKAEHGRRVRRH